MGHILLNLASIGQIITLPLAIYMKLKWAYICTYLFGMLYGRIRKEDSQEYTTRVNMTIYLICIIGLLIRFILFLKGDVDNSTYGRIFALMEQWIKLFQGAGLFIFMHNILSNIDWNGVSDRLSKYIFNASAMTYEVYLVHEFFLREIFTNFVDFTLPYNVFICWFMIVVSGFAINRISKSITRRIK